jgi:hypothetical protein
MKLPLLLGAVASALGAGVADAQTSQVLGREWEDVVTGRGIKVGDGTVMHPVAGVETGIINNVFFEEDAGRTAGMIRLVGEVAFASLPPERLNDPGRSVYERPLWRKWTGSIYQTYDGPYWRDDDGENDDAEGENVGAPPRLEFRAGARAYYEEYLSGDEEVRAQRNLGFNGNLHLHVNPYELLAFTLDEDLTRAIRPTNFESASDLDRWINNLRLGLRIQAGGRALVPELRLHNRIDYFESESSAFANRVQTTAGGRLNWWYTRYTRFFFDASIGAFGGLGGGAQGMEKASSFPLRLLLGASTPFTETTSLSVHAGFAKGFYSAGPDFTGPLIAGRFSWGYNDFGRLIVGYRYDFQDSINANFYTDHVIEGAAVQQIDRLVLEARAEIHLRHYDGVPMEFGGSPVRDDFIFAAGGTAKYLLREWLGLSGQLQFVTDQTGYVGTGGDDPSYTRFELLGGVVSAF